MISSLLNELNEDDDKVRKEKMISGVAAAAYTGSVHSSLRMREVLNPPCDYRRL